VHSNCPEPGLGDGVSLVKAIAIAHHRAHDSHQLVFSFQDDEPGWFLPANS
jgi:hypothetical protein